jgi:hypothetical protein
MKVEPLPEPLVGLRFVPESDEEQADLEQVEWYKQNALAQISRIDEGPPGE